MQDRIHLTGRLIAAARALVGVGREDFATAAGLALEALIRIEKSGSASVDAPGEIAALERGLTHFGVVVVEESNGMGAGVRLKFTRQDTKQILRLEGEGGMIGSDDAP